MSKNLTRKGLAFGALVALGSTVIAGSPALAANEVVLAPSAGTTYAMVSGNAFTLQATAGATIASSSYGNLKYEVTNASGLALTTVFTQAGSSADNDLSASTTTTAQVIRSTAGTVTGSSSTLALSVGASDAGTVSVNSWIDSDGDNVIDGSEYSSGAQTITFVKAADVTWTTALTQPALGDTKFTAVVSNNKSINSDQVKSKIRVGFASYSGATYTAVGANTSVTAGDFSSTTDNGETTTYVSADNSLKAEVTAAPTANTYYAAQALWNTSGTVWAELGAEAQKSVGAATIVKITTPTSTASDDIAVGTGTVSVRNGATSVPVSVQAYSAYSDANTNTKAAAGQTVKVTITESTATGNTDAASFTAGGKTLKDTTAAADKIEFDATTDANGKVSFDIAVAGTVAGTDAIRVTVAAQAAIAVSGNLYADVSFADATVAAAALKDANTLGASAIFKRTAGSSYSLKFAAVDSFGKGLGSNYRVLVTESGANPDVVSSAVFSNGVATLSFTDSTTISESYSAQLQVYSSTTQTWGNGSFTPAVVVTPVIGTSNAVDSVATFTATALTGLDLNLDTLKAADTRIGEDAPTVVTGTVATLSGTVADALTSGTYSDVTISGSGVMFENNGVYTLGSITVQTNASGAFGGVKVYSNTAGEVILTATAGAKSKTLSLTFDNAAAGTGTSWVLDAPDYIAAGRTLVITPKATDKWGNSVADAVVLTYDGPGLPISSTTPTTAGTAYKVLLGAGETGTIKVTLKIDKNADTDYLDSGEVITKSIVIGSAPVAAPVAVAAASGSTGKFFASVTNAAGKKVVVKVSGKFVTSFTGTLAKKSVAVAALKGNRTVTIYVGGQLVLTKLVTIK